jgi:hypothetical protein
MTRNVGNSVSNGSMLGAIRSRLIRVVQMLNKMAR